MRLKSIRATAFGCWRNLAVDDLDHNLLVVYGPNEAGKSTFFHLIETLFYGWRPLKNNPHFPWQGGKASLAAELITQNGEIIEVQRSLGSRAVGTVIRGETSTNLGNKSLGMLSFLSRTVFSEVYFLALEQLRFPDSRAWQELQDQLLGGQFFSFLKPVSAVLTDLEEEAATFWRPDRRGKPEAKLLQERILALTQRKREIEENEAKLREREQDLFKLGQKQKQIQAERVGLLSDLNRAERLLPLKKRLTYLAQLEAEAGDCPGGDEWGEDPRQYYARLESDLRELATIIEKTVEKKGQYLAQEALFGPAEQAYLAQIDEISAVTRAYSLLASDQQEIGFLQGELCQKEKHLGDYAATFLLGTEQEELAVKFADIDEVALQTEIASFRESQNKYLEKANQLQDFEKQAKEGQHRCFFLPVVISFCSLGLSGVLWWGNTPLGLAAALLLILGLGWGLFSFSTWRKKPETSEGKRIAKELQFLGEKKAAKRQKVAEILQDLPFVAARLEAPDESIWVEVKNMKAHLRQKADLQEKLTRIQARLSSYQEKVEHLFRELKINSEGELLADLRQLEAGVAYAQECQTKAVEARRNLAEIKEQLLQGQNNTEKLEAAKELFVRKIKKYPGETITEKMAYLARQKEKRGQIQTLQQELVREYPDWEALEKEIHQAENNGLTWLFSDYELAEKKVALGELEEEWANLKEEKARVATELKHLGARERLDDLTGALRQLQVEQEEACQKRDRLILLRNIIREADRTFREKHQPDVLQKAGTYLAQITGGRYHRLLMEDDPPGLLVQNKNTGQLLRAEFPLSRGTLEQIYLALRLALCAHLDEGQEIVPLFLDEILINWDGTRLEFGLEILGELAQKRQVFVFTCHDWLVQKMRQKGAVRVIELK